MRSILFLSLLVLSLFPACKRQGKHSPVTSTTHVCNFKQDNNLADACELVDRSKLGKGVACLVAAPATLGVGVFMGANLIMAGMVVPGFGLLGSGVAIGAFAGFGFLVWKGCTYLSQHACANKEREQFRCKSCKKIHVERVELFTEKQRSAEEKLSVTY